MRLINAFSNGKWSLTPDLPTSPGPYAILSHTWGADDDEVNFKDIQKASSIDKEGLTKLSFCAEQARRDGLEYFWIDTCCIDRANLVELSEAITSMFRWYRQAKKCYVYLSDVSTNVGDTRNPQQQWESAFRASRWFQRGWTLQELLAPTTVEFFSREQKLLGSKQTLESLIHDITKIPVDALKGEPLSQFSVDQRLQWARGRQTRKVEDRAYCLLGVFGVSMSLRYGEGEEALTRLEKKVKGLQKNIASPDLVNWLAPSRPRELHAKISNSRHPGTGLHFTEGLLISWLSENFGTSSLIWITGKSGTGKTTLFSHIVDATERFTSNQSGTTVAYHYCAFSNSESQRLINILGSLVIQISASQPGILEDIKPIFERDQERKQVKTLQVLELERILIKYGTRLDTVVLLIDALNESEDFIETCACIGRLLQQLPGLKVLTTSTIRIPLSIINQAVHLLPISMDPLEDIQTFVDSNLENHVTLRCLSAHCKSIIRTSLVGKADQSFRWVALVLDSLCRQRTERAVLRVLTQLPEDLHDIYGKMVGIIPAEDRTIAREVLLWTCFSLRPMTLFELSEAAILDDCDGFLDSSARLVRPEVILEICHGLLDFDASNGTVKLAHSSVRTYLLSQHNRDADNGFWGFTIEEGNRALMRRCLTYLLLDNFKTGANRNPFDVTSRSREFGLFGYAAHYWGLHASHATRSEWDLVQQLFYTRDQPYGGNYGAWGSCVMPGWRPSVVVATDALYYAASLGMDPLLKALLTGNVYTGHHSIDLEASGGRYKSTALQVACFRMREGAASILVAAGADFWTEDSGSGKPAWFWATANGWGDIVDDMIKRRPEIAGLMTADSFEIKREQYFQRLETYVIPTFS